MSASIFVFARWAGAHCARLLAACCLVSACIVGAARATTQAEGAELRRLILEAHEPRPNLRPGRDARQHALAFYARRAHALAWMRDDGPVPTPAAGAAEAVAMLSDAQTRGLRPGDYDAAWLRAQLSAPLDRKAALRFDASLTLGVVRYLLDASLGRIDPGLAGMHLPVRRDRAAVDAAIDRVVGSDAPASAVAAFEPDLRLYRDLLGQLADQRRLANEGPLPALPPIRGKLVPGDRVDGLPALAERLRRYGDLGDSPDAPPPERYEGGLVEAVKRFQERHGLDPDGVVGRQTLAALAVPPAARVRQIELSLERLRWLGRRPPGRFVAINIPEYRLWAVPPTGSSAAPLEMRVIVGASVTATPVFTDAIEAVELNPYWNVPPSIASKELYPKLVRDPGYLAREQMELLGAAGGDLRRALASGRARLRQKPGELNALGKIKFVMPNAFNVYLHDTPARQLFERSRRDFSHGCIRLQRPFELALFALADQPNWDAAAIEQAIAEGRNRSVPLAAPIEVLILYSTVNIGAVGRVRFLPDVYGQDDKLARALGD
jgi:murein L,D-transpeptidase YcbB/YkuD